MQSILDSFKPEIIQVFVIAVFFIALVLIGLLLNALRRTQWFVANEKAVLAVGQKALELLIHTEYGTEYESVAHEYDEKAHQRSVNGLFFVDPRMLFVIDKLELWANTRFGISLEFDDLLQIAEAKYQEVKLDPLNDIFAPSKIALLAVEETPTEA